MRRSLITAAVLAAALSAACDASTTSPNGSASGTGATTTTGAAAASEDVAWVDEVCGEIVELIDTQSADPPNLTGGDAATAVREFDAYVGRNIGTVDQAIAGLRDVGPSPVQGGDQTLSGLVEGLEALKTGYQTIRQQLSGINLNDPQAAQNAVTQAFQSLAEGGTELGAALQAMESNPELRDAAAQAQNCQRLDDGAPATSGTSTATPSTTPSTTGSTTPSTTATTGTATTS